MSFDLSWLWFALNNLTSIIQLWFNGIWSVVQNIGNTGQGIFSGLVAFGSQLWDAIVKAFDKIGQWIYNAFSWIYNAFSYVANIFGQWVGTAFSWIGSAVAWVAQQIYNFGNWIYNGLTFIWNWIVNTAQAVWGAITSFFSGVANAIGSWWGNVVSGINSWFTNLVISIRNKIVNTIMADVSIYFGWKSMERLMNVSSVKDAGFSILGLVGAPLLGYLFGNIIDGLIPTPSTTPIQLIPEITPLSYSPPSLTITTPTERPIPSVGTIPAATVIGAGLPYDTTITMPKSPTYDFTMMTTDNSLTPPTAPTYEYMLT